jgi:hypothetical protein
MRDLRRKGGSTAMTCRENLEIGTISGIGVPFRPSLGLSSDVFTFAVLFPEKKNNTFRNPLLLDIQPKCGR